MIVTARSSYNDNDCKSIQTSLYKLYVIGRNTIWYMTRFLQQELFHSNDAKVFASTKFFDVVSFARKDPTNSLRDNR